MKGNGRHSTVRLSRLAVTHDGQTFERNLVECRRLVLQRRIEGVFGNVAELARRLSLSQSTVYCWLRGTIVGSEETTSRILAGLGVEFGDVHHRVEVRDESRIKTT